jgi:hypothetical protein
MTRSWQGGREREFRKMPICLGGDGEGIEQFRMAASNVPPAADLAKVHRLLDHEAGQEWWAMKRDASLRPGRRPRQTELPATLDRGHTAANYSNHRDRRQPSTAPGGRPTSRRDLSDRLARSSHRGVRDGAGGTVRGMSTESAPECPVCGTALTSGGFVLNRREDDRKRTCRSLWRCAASHLWWRWADRPGEALEPCPYPDLFAR